MHRGYVIYRRLKHCQSDPVDLTLLKKLFWLGESKAIRLNIFAFVI